MCGLYFIDYHSVCLIYNGIVKGGKIDSCCAFRVVSHSFAYNSNWNILAFSYAGPGVTGYIHCDMGWQFQYF